MPLLAGDLLSYLQQAAPGHNWPLLSEWVLATCSLSHSASTSSSPSSGSSHRWRRLGPVGPMVIHPSWSCLAACLSWFQHSTVELVGWEVWFCNTLGWWHPKSENILPSPSTLGVNSCSCLVQWVLHKKYDYVFCKIIEEIKTLHELDVQYNMRWVGHNPKLSLTGSFHS